MALASVKKSTTIKKTRTSSKKGKSSNKKKTQTQLEKSITKKKTEETFCYHCLKENRIICKSVEITYDDGKKDKKKSSSNECPYYLTENGRKLPFHWNCLEAYLRKKYKNDNQTVVELLEKSKKEHDEQIEKLRKKGSLYEGQLKIKREERKDKEALINYFFGYYGAIKLTKNITNTIKNLNDGTASGLEEGVCIPYIDQLNMFVYYKDELESIFRNKEKKGTAPTDINSRIMYDLTIISGRYEDYLTRPEVMYNESNHEEIITDEPKINYRDYITPVNDSQERKEADKRVNEFLDYFEKQFWEQFDED